MSQRPLRPWDYGERRAQSAQAKHPAPMPRPRHMTLTHNQAGRDYQRLWQSQTDAAR